MPQPVSVYIVLPNQNEAEIIANRLVEQKLAACVNILPDVRSIYRWQGQVEQAVEVAIIAKSDARLMPRIEACVQAHCSYECPCVVAWPIAAGHKPYLNWLDEQLAQ